MNLGEASQLATREVCIAWQGLEGPVEQRGSVQGEM